MPMLIEYIDALDWSRLDFSARKDEMQRILFESIIQRKGSKNMNGKLFAAFNGTEVLLIHHSIPAAITVSAAKEMVGQPFRYDHLYAPTLTGNRSGPVHVIACHKSATEAQATRLLGFSDATVVSAPFGIFVADEIHKIQFAFIVNCRDEANTRLGVQRFFEWLEQSGEDDHLVRRARSRSKIVTAIALEETP